MFATGATGICGRDGTFTLNSICPPVLWVLRDARGYQSGDGRVVDDFGNVADLHDPVMNFW